MSHFLLFLTRWVFSQWAYVIVHVRVLAICLRTIVLIIICTEVDLSHLIKHFRFGFSFNYFISNLHLYPQFFSLLNHVIFVCIDELLLKYFLHFGFSLLFIQYLIGDTINRPNQRLFHLISLWLLILLSELSFPPQCFNFCSPCFLFFCEVHFFVCFD